MEPSATDIRDLFELLSKLWGGFHRRRIQSQKGILSGREDQGIYDEISQVRRVRNKESDEISSPYCGGFT
jgi:hypothetical protein